MNASREITTRQRIKRTLQPGETLRAETWAGPLRHRISQRNYLVYDGHENCVLSGAGNWAIADRDKRSMVDANGYGLSFPAEMNDRELPRPSAPEKLPITGSADYIVTEADLDMNQHMNNTRYFDIAEDLVFGGKPCHKLLNAQAAFQNEALLGERLVIFWGNREKRWYVCGEGNGKICFQMSLQYGE